MTTCENISMNIEEVDNLGVISQQPIIDPDAELNEMFSLSKKKKKKKDKDDIDETNIDKEILDEFSLRKPKKNKNKKEKELETSESTDKPEYSYQELLGRVYSSMEINQIQVIKQNKSLKIPFVQRVSSKKTGWMNFNDCCSSIGRDKSLIINYLTSELSTEASIDGNGVLLIRGIYTQKNIENILRKFVVNFVQCSVCKSLETSIRKEQSTRINFLDCNTCKSSRALQQIIAIQKSALKSK